MPTMNNLLKKLPIHVDEELFETLLQGQTFRLERIVSTGQVTPVGQWYDQVWDEWVILLSGAARLRFADEQTVHDLKPGDYVLIPAHCRHRVEWTDPEQASVWLALHVQAESQAP